MEREACGHDESRRRDHAPGPRDVGQRGRQRDQEHRDDVEQVAVLDEVRAEALVERRDLDRQRRDGEHRDDPERAILVGGPRPQLRAGPRDRDERREDPERERDDRGVLSDEPKQLERRAAPSRDGDAVVAEEARRSADGEHGDEQHDAGGAQRDEEAPRGNELAHRTADELPASRTAAGFDEKCLDEHRER